MGLKPRARISRLRILTPREWKVEITIPSAIEPAMELTRSRISRAALLVNVTARMFSAGMRLSFNRWTMRVVMTWVLPEPAPARISRAPSV